MMPLVYDFPRPAIFHWRTLLRRCIIVTPKMRSYPYFGTRASSGIEAHLVVSQEWISLQVHVLKRWDIWNWLTLATSYIRVTSVPYINIINKSRVRLRTKTNEKIKRRPSLLSQAAGLEPILDRWRRRRSNSKWTINALASSNLYIYLQLVL